MGLSDARLPQIAVEKDENRGWMNTSPKASVDIGESETIRGTDDRAPARENVLRGSNESRRAINHFY